MGTISVNSTSVGIMSVGAIPVIPEIPIFVSAEITIEGSPSEILVLFNIKLDDTIYPDNSAFGLLVNNIAVQAKIVYITSPLDESNLSYIVITKDPEEDFLFGDIITLTYTKPLTNPLKSLTGGEVASFSEPVTNNIQALAFVSAEIPFDVTDTIALTFNIDLNNESPVDVSAFEVIVNSIPIVINIDFVNSYGGILMLYREGDQFAYGDIITISYTKPALNPLKSLTGGEVASFSEPVTNNIQAP